MCLPEQEAAEGATRMLEGKTWRETTGRGDETELAVALALARTGKKILRPLSSATRYDLLVDNEDGTFLRVQCKTGRLRNGCVRFDAFSVSGHSTTSKGYEGQIDAFGVYCPETDTTYLVPIGALRAGATVGHLRVVPARNGQRSGVRMASDFVLAPALSALSAR